MFLDDIYAMYESEEDKDLKDAEKLDNGDDDFEVKECTNEEDDIYSEKCCKEEDEEEFIERCYKEEDDEDLFEGCYKEEDDEEVDVSDDEVSDIEEAMIFDDSFELFESVCGPFECNTSNSVDDIDKYLNDRDVYSSSTTDEVDDMIDGSLHGEGSDEIVPDSVDILGTNTDDFDYTCSYKEEEGEDEDIEELEDEDVLA